MVIHQALYGERGGAHRLLAKSSNEKEPFSKLETHTDRPGDPPSGYEWKPFVSGFALGTHWVFTKTFPDTTATRPGMVLTHALIMPLDDLIQLADIGPLLALLPDLLPSREARSSVTNIEWSPKKAIEEEKSEAAGLGAVVHALFETEDGKRPIVWLGYDGFVPVVESLWRCLWPGMRRALRFRLSFEAHDVSRQSPTLIYTPTRLAARWTEFTCVRPSDTPSSPSRAEAFLRGLPEGESLRVLFAHLGIEPESLRQLRDAAERSLYVDKLELSPGEARSLARLAGRLAPAPEQGREFKNHVLNQLWDGTQKGDAADVLALRNFDPTPFSDGDKAPEVAGVWVAAHLLEPIRALEVAEVIKSAINPLPGLLTEKWARAVVTSARRTLASWPTGSHIAAQAVWNWWLHDLTLVEGCQSLLPNGGIRSQSIERDLARACPSRVESSLAEKVRCLAIERGWLSLHVTVLLAAVATGEMDEATAWREQLHVDQDTRVWEGVKLLAENTSPESLLEVALDTGDERTLTLISRACVQKSSLLAALDVEEARWRKIWIEAIASGAPPWTGVPQPQEVMHSLINRIVESKVVEPELLFAISTTPYADLTMYSNRAQIWNAIEIIEPRSISQFLDVTADGWWKSFESGTIEIDFSDHLERPLQNAVLMDGRLWPKLESATQAESALRIFERFPSLSSMLFERWLDRFLSQHRQGEFFTPTTAKHIGSLIEARQWSSVAQKLAHNSHRPGVLTAAQACESLLSFFERLRLKVVAVSGASHCDGKNNHNREVLSHDELWELCAEVAAQLYPWGPGDKDLWNRAKGDMAQLNHIHGSGAASWKDALRRLRHGGGGKDISIERLLREMSDEFPRHDEVNFLWQHRERMDD